MLIDRRSFLAGAAALAGGACVRNYRPGTPPPDYLAYARGAARYIRANAVRTEHGLAWKKSPDEPDALGTDLYHGSAGIVLFLVELYRATQERRVLDDAIQGMAHIVATWPADVPVWQTGLHGGLAGHVVVLRELVRETRDAQHHAWLTDAIARLRRALPPGPDGVRLGGITDMLYGSAGCIVVQLAIGDEAARSLAIGLGDGLLASAQSTAKGQRWLMRPDDADEMPNFSHGTAGVAFALACLYEATRDPRYLDAAIAGANHILSLARTDGDVCLVPHRLPEGAQRYYLGYCHGPAGTARLFHQLHLVTRDPRWGEWFRRSINGVLLSGIPEHRTPGFWDNVGQCCGTAAIAELALSLHRLTDDPTHADFAHALAGDIVRRATRGPGGELEWIHAENRVEPYWKQSFTGYMQGAAGIGSLFVRLAGHDAHRTWKIRLPDNRLPL